MIYDPKGCIFDMSKYGISHKKVFDCVGRPGHNDFLRNTSSIQSRSYKQSASILIYIYMLLIQSIILIKLNDSMLK